MDSVPFNSCSCSSLITSVRYGPRRQFQLIFKDPSKPIFETESPKELSMTRRKAKWEDHGVKEVRVYLPLDILKVVHISFPFDS
ncbi:hypothetical protein DPMN_016686 [Dreissena polymorpha]|uniref:Uncharacterized protein n=1 Tax=Dreissena polymorpha TaxID=45954 RepID=A0A9D4NA45_DREPO|nr:hypothetical protein DPMN_016686 [Dreissena polymorpha]